MPHSTLPLPLESLDCSPSPQPGGTPDTLPYAVLGGRFTHWMSCSIHGGRPHVTTRLRVERCSMLSRIGMRECSTLNRDAYAREPCLRRSLRALRLKADAVAWSSLRNICTHIFTPERTDTPRLQQVAGLRRARHYAPSSKVLWSCLMWDDADSHPAHARCLTVVSPQRPTALARTLAAVSHSYACLRPR